MKEYGKMLVKLITSNLTQIKIISLLIFLKRTNDKNIINIQLKHSKKLNNLYGSPLDMKQDIDNVLNLSDIEIDTETLKILKLGLNTHLKTKFDEIEYKKEIEKLYE